MNAVEEIRAYLPDGEQEERDRTLMLDFLAKNDNAFLRENQVAHMTASAWVLSPDRRRVVMGWHNIYKSWSWVGGHADGDTDLLAVAIRETAEETGLDAMPLQDGIFSLECLPVAGHRKNGVYVSSHLHLNVTYLLQARDETLRTKPDENSAVRWLTPAETLTMPAEAWMVEWVYRKLTARAERYMRGINL